MPPRCFGSVIACTLAGALGACTAGAQSRRPDTPDVAAASAPAGASRSSQAWLRDLVGEIGDAACDDDSQCRSVAIGAKSCGGPEGYLAWSSKVSQPGRVSDLAGRQAEARSAENRRSRTLSNCSVTPDPGAVCQPRAEDGRRVCQPGPAGRAGPR